MKAIVFFLVLVNVLFYAWGAGVFGGKQRLDGLRIGQQVNPDSVRIVSRGDAPGAAAPVETPVAQPVAAPEPEKAVAPPPPPVPAVACLTWQSLSVEVADRVLSEVRTRFPDYTVSRLSTNGDSNGWWVHISSFADRASAHKKAVELPRLGVEDYFIVEDGDRYAISLGVFSSEKGARDRLAALRTKGVQSARVGLRPDPAGTVGLELRGPAQYEDALRAVLPTLAPKQTPQSCK